MPDKKIRIAYLGNQIYPGGGAMSLYLMVKCVNSDLFDKFVFASQCRSEEMKEDLKKYCNDVIMISLDEVVSCQSYTTPGWLVVKTLLFSTKRKRRLLNYLEDYKIDILHVNNSVFSYTYKYIKRNSSIKIVSHVREMIDHSGIGLVQSFIIRNIFKFSDTIIAISPTEAIPFEGHSNLHVLPNPFDFSKILNIESTFRSNISIDNETIVVGMMGQFFRNKGQLDFLRALKYLIDNKLTERKFQFLIIGVTPPKKGWKVILKRLLLMKDYRNEVEKFILENNLGDHIQLIPFSHQIFSILVSIDIIVRPSINGDPWGRDIIEAMAFSKPIVATGTSQFYIREGDTGYLVNPRNFEGLAVKISDLINDDLKRNSFGTKGKQVIENLCNMDVYSKHLFSFYYRLYAER